MFTQTPVKKKQEKRSALVFQGAGAAAEKEDDVFPGKKGGIKLERHLAVLL